MTIEQSDVWDVTLRTFQLQFFPDSFFLYSWGSCRGGNPWFSPVPQSLRW